MKTVCTYAGRELRIAKITTPALVVLLLSIGDSYEWLILYMQKQRINYPVKLSSKGLLLSLATGDHHTIRAGLEPVK